MALSTHKNLKLYYSISEVAKMFDVSESLLRYWETEFPTLKPKTLPNRVRQYTEDDINVVRSIHNLLKVRGFKIAAARKMLYNNPDNVNRSEDILSTLISVRDELKAIKKHLDAMR